MSISIIHDIESVRFSAPDLDKMRKFLIDFGMRDAEDAGDGVLRMRGKKRAGRNKRAMDEFWAFAPDR